MKPHTPTAAIDAFIGDETQMGKKKKETGSESLTQPLWTIWLPLMTRTDHMVGLFWSPPAHRGIYIYNPSRQQSRYYITGRLGEEGRQENMEKEK